MTRLVSVVSCSTGAYVEQSLQVCRPEASPGEADPAKAVGALPGGSAVTSYAYLQIFGCILVVVSSK